LNRTVLFTVVDANAKSTQLDIHSEFFGCFTLRRFCERFACFDSSTGNDPVAPTTILTLNQRNVTCSNDDYANSLKCHSSIMAPERFHG
jgi:hypothetical protein